MSDETDPPLDQIEAELRRRWGISPNFSSPARSPANARARSELSSRKRFGATGVRVAGIKRILRPTGHPPFDGSAALSFC